MVASLSTSLQAAIERANNTAYRAVGVLEVLDEQGALPVWARDQVLDILTEMRDAHTAIVALQQRMGGARCH